MSSVTLVRCIAARPEIVFETVSTPEGIASWWGPDDIAVLSAKSDPRVGGRFEVRFCTLDGLEHLCAGEFLEVVRPHRIVMSWQWISGGEPREGENVSRVEFHLQPIDTGTELTLTHAALLDELSAQGHQRGWGRALDKLMRNFARN